MPRKKNIDPHQFTQRVTEHYRDEICHLHWDKERPWTLLFAVILSAQATDVGVNKATPSLFKNFPDLESFVAKPLELIEQEVKTIGLYRSKAKNLKKCAEQILTLHNGKVPDNMDDLINLAGVGRKTANVILWNIFEKNEGFVVDTHVGRISQRTGLTKAKTPEKIEKDLMKKIEQKQWGPMSHRLVQFGRDFCVARNPKCKECFLKDICPKINTQK